MFLWTHNTFTDHDDPIEIQQLHTTRKMTTFLCPHSQYLMTHLQVGKSKSKNEFASPTKNEKEKEIGPHGEFDLLNVDSFQKKYGTLSQQKWYERKGLTYWFNLTSNLRLTILQSAEILLPLILCFINYQFLFPHFSHPGTLKKKQWIIMKLYHEVLKRWIYMIGAEKLYNFI